MRTSTYAPIAIAAPHEAAVRAAATIVSAGGNAVDAALAAAAALTVVYPHMCSLGGDMIAIVRLPNGDRICVNSTGAYGSRFSLAEVLDGRAAMPVEGPLTVSVPGVVAGWHAMHEAWGSISTEQLLQPAIELAALGTSVSPGLAEAIADDAATLREDPGMASVFFPEGKALTAGADLVQPALAHTLSALARDGLTSFYTGDTAALLDEGFAALGVPVTAEDLSAHVPRIEQPIARRVGDLRVSTAAPNSQGFTMLRTLGALRDDDTGALSTDTGLLAELFHSGDRIRDTALADPRFAPVDVDGMLQPEGLRRAREEAESSLRTGTREAAIHTPRPGGDTVAITVVDADGMAISLIQSVFHSFGCKLLEPLTGVVLHNRAAFFQTEPGHPNVVAIGKRPAHTLMPVIVESPDGTIAAHGTMGGKAQAQIHTQLLLRVLEGATPLEAVSAPRLIVGDSEHGTDDRDSVLIEPGIAETAQAQLAATTLEIRRGHENDSGAGHAMIARRNPDGRLSAGADPRSDGGVHVSD
ncbi:gamma-glutamyltransferase family protein [Microbacterium sp. 3J1]|uniref:gamma-glutamyltransferase family protein n=1 Tax=Microbacterium sp. 3J1 TaxID=861269 RepID=UPI000A604D0C|nr:gamma-glutamyltransferase [Microbacterium sp. 3J1]